MRPDQRIRPGTPDPQHTRADTLRAVQLGEDRAAISTEAALILEATPIDPTRVYEIQLSELRADGTRDRLLNARLPAAGALPALQAVLDTTMPDLLLTRTDRATLTEQLQQLHAALHHATTPIDPAQIAARTGGTPRRFAGMAPEGHQRTEHDDATRIETLATPTGRDPALIELRQRRPWAAFVRAVAGEDVLADAGWPGLAAGLDRAAASGWDVTANLPQLVALRELPATHAARELYCRLVDACDAAARAAVASIAEINARGTTPAPNARDRAELARTPTRPAPQAAPAR
jgi:hypothetical protein